MNRKKQKYTLPLPDGQTIQCWLKKNISVPADNDKSTANKIAMINDIRLSKTKRRKIRRELYEEHERQQLEKENRFVQHVPLFYKNIDKILSDSRLFLMPVPVVSGLSFFGTSGFQNPILGVYALWWRNCFDASHDVNGHPIYLICGSILSGLHVCKSVNLDNGEKQEAELRGRLIDTFLPFIQINRIYKEHKQLYAAYTMEEAVRILSKQTAPKKQSIWYRFFMFHSK